MEQISHKPLIIKLCVIVACMFLFSYALVPLYNVLCKATGINGKIELEAADYRAFSDLDSTRVLNITLDTNVNSGLNCKFSSSCKKVKLHPGQIGSATFTMTNPYNYPIHVQAIPSMAPGIASRHMKKIECFCFRKQTLQANETKYFPLIFVIDSKIPNNISYVTLSYTLFYLHGDKEVVKNVA